MTYNSSVMISGAERERQLVRLRDMLVKADEYVWGNPSYPQDHRPDISHLLPRITIGNWLATEYESHPGMKPEILADLTIQRQQAQARSQLNKVGWFNPVTRQIIIAEQALIHPDQFVERFVWHQAARDNSNRLEVIPPSHYSPFFRERIPLLLDLAFPAHNRPDISETTVLKRGFRRLLFVGEYSISNLHGPDGAAKIDMLDQIYATAVEIITHQGVQRWVDINSLDHDAKRGQLVASPHEDHPRFADMLFREMRYIDWRHILTAFVSGEMEEAVRILEQHAQLPRIGAGLFLELLSTMEQDERFITQINATVAQGPFSLS